VALTVGAGERLYAGPPDYAVERASMVGRLRASGITDARLLAALQVVRRHEFVDAGDRTRAYAEVRIPVGAGCALHPPSILADAIQPLHLNPRARVLQVGAGAGYTSAVLSEITPHVYVVDMRKRTLDNAKLRVGALGYNTVAWKHGNGCRGWGEHAPYDAVLVTCAADHVPQTLIDQLAEGGRMVIPVGRGPEQSLNCVQKVRDSRSVRCKLQTTVAVHSLRSRFDPMVCRASRR
jgi:protein-L-isoaspartate(D-aspartate) O-methyltransferase